MKKRSIPSLRQLLFLAAFVCAFGTLTFLLFTYKQDEKRFTNISSRLFTEELAGSTLNMHYTVAHPEDFGIYDYEPSLPGYSAEGSLQGKLALENTLADLRAIRRDKLTPSDAYLYRRLTRYLENSLKLNSFSYYSEPLSPSSGMQTQLPILLAEYTFRSRRDVEDYLALLDQTDEYFASLLAYEQERSDAGLLSPAASLKSVRAQCDAIVTKQSLEAGTHFLQTTFEERLQPLLAEGTLSEAEVQKYLAVNDRLLKTVVLPAYIALGDGLILLEDESLSLTGLGALPQGKEYYEALLVSETGSYRPVAEIQELLTAQFTDEYEAIRSLLDSCPGAAWRYRDNDAIAFPYTGAAQMLADLQERMKESFPAVPGETVSVTVKPVSESLESYTAPAFYLTAPLDDTSDNVIYINTQKTLTDLELYTTLAHEGYPGHLYQTVYHNRRSLEQGARSAGELIWYGGYLEGWAVYVEFLSYDHASALLRESGLEEDAVLIQIEKHNRSLQLCLYSLLDIMIHYENASFNKIAKVLESFGITDAASATAIYTYIAQEPCNYLKYYLGYLEILSLQEKARIQWGDSYTDYDFHCFYLDNGPADFLSLREQLETWNP
ncbi:MAG: DUF885 domain-containing protein [Firmicutes bacterium]|nr:DUF885 domain-containing protein [Bacillota bacterium]